VREPSPDDVFGRVEFFQGGASVLNFRVGQTLVVYGGVLSAVLTLSLVACMALAVLNVRRREQTKCPHCRSDVPRDAQICRFCILELEPA
jgi:hypothetical protein